MQSKSCCYRVIYDDDLDTWSVVTTPFDGIYFAGTKSQCEQFLRMGRRSLSTARKPMFRARNHDDVPHDLRAVDRGALNLETTPHQDFGRVGVS